MGQMGKAYTDEERLDIIERITDRLMDGQSLRRICAEDDTLPNRSTVLRWLNEEHGAKLAAIIARGRQLQADALDDEIQDITRKVTEGELDPQAARVAIWAMQWRASKMRPRRYGDRVAHEHSGEDGKPIQVITADMPADRAAAIYKDLIER